MVTPEVEELVKTNTGVEEALEEAVAVVAVVLELLEELGGVVEMVEMDTWAMTAKTVVMQSPELKEAEEAAVEEEVMEAVTEEMAAKEAAIIYFQLPALQD